MTKYQVINGAIVSLYDKYEDKIALISITDTSGSSIQGRIIENKLSPPTQILFDQFRDLVENQIFSLLDNFVDKIDMLGLNLGKGKPQIHDVQIVDDLISFKIK